MTKEQFNLELRLAFNYKELALINTNIYFNEEHIDYYISYNSAKYNECFNYLIENRNLLTIKNTPNGMKTTAKKMLKNAKKLFT